MKRLFDIVFSLTMLAVFSIVIIIVSLLIRWKLGSPILFKQERIGYKEIPFYIFKFRTMTDDTDENGNLLSNNLRMTKLGLWIRKLSLDELPQLINVLKGEMSVVGPRPLLIRYLPFYKKEERVRHDVKPGITGLAQVEGRNFMPWSERFLLDIYYVKNQSLLLDGKILVRTAIKVFRRDDIEDVPGECMLDLDDERRVEQTTGR